MRRLLLAAAMAVVFLFGAFQSGAAAKAVGGCPSGDSWQLVTVASLGISPDQAAGIPSLDGNGDGYTCIAPSPAAPNSFPAGGFIFRDNTVVGS